VHIIYLWINATPNSNVFNISEIGIKIINDNDGDKEQVNELNRCINKCPAVIFATNRTDNVIGRIKFLTISIKIIIGISMVGEPIGTIWDNILFVFLNEK